jgi:hypothetical protein
MLGIIGQSNCELHSVDAYDETEDSRHKIAKVYGKHGLWT